MGCVLAEMYINRGVKYGTHRYRPLFAGRNSFEQLTYIEELFTKHQSDHRCIENAIGFQDQDEYQMRDIHPFIDFLKVRLIKQLIIFIEMS